MSAPRPTRAIAERRPRGGSSIGWLYLHRLRPIIAVSASIVLAILAVSISEDELLRVAAVGLFSGIVVGGALVLLARRRGCLAAIRLSLYLDLVLITAAIAQLPEPRGYPVIYLWPIVLAAMLIGHRDIAAATIGAVACVIAVPLLRGSDNYGSIGVDAVLLAAVGAVIATLRIGELRADEDRRRLEHQLKEAQQLAQVGSFEWDGATDTSIWSDELYRIYGMEGGTPLGMHDFLAAIVDEDREQVTAAMQQAIEGTGIGEFDATIRCPDGQLRAIHAIGTRVDGGGSEGAPRVVGSVQDVTKLRRLDSMREEFVAAASHELRTPTAIIAGFATTLVSEWERLPESDRRRFVGEIDSAARRLSMLIEDVLQVTEIESGHVRARAVEFDLRAAVEDIARSWPGDLRIELEPPVATPIVAVGDPERTQQVLTNLLANAERLAAPGAPVHLAISDGDGRAKLRVRDQGPGIDADDHARIFERFVRLERDTPGTGLGLYISRRLAEAQGGTLSVESVPGEGATFTLSLPAAAGRVDA